MSDEIWATLAKGAEALSPLFLAILSWLSVRIARLVDARIKNEHIASVLHRLDDAVAVAVREVEQVVVTQLKAASSDGILNADERVRVKGAALAAARTYIGFKGLLEIAKILGLKSDELDRLVEARVEAAVYDMRTGRGPVLNGAGKSP